MNQSNTTTSPAITPVFGTAPVANMVTPPQVTQPENVTKQTGVSASTGPAAVVTPGPEVASVVEPEVAGAPVATPPGATVVRATRRSTRPPPGFEAFTPPILVMPAGHLAAMPAENLAVMPAENLAAMPAGNLAAMPAGNLVAMPAEGSAIVPDGNLAAMSKPGTAITPTPGPGEVACLLCSQPFQLPTTPGRPFKYCEGCRRNRKKRGTNMNTMVESSATSDLTTTAISAFITTPNNNAAEFITTNNTNTAADAITTTTTTTTTTDTRSNTNTADDAIITTTTNTNTDTRSNTNTADDAIITTTTNTNTPVQETEASEAADTGPTTTASKDTIFCRTCKKTRPKPAPGHRPQPKGVGVSCDACRERRRHYYEKSKQHGGEKRAAASGVSKLGRKKRRTKKPRRETSSELDDIEDDEEAPASPGIRWNFAKRGRKQCDEGSLNGDEMELDQAQTEELEGGAGRHAQNNGKGKKRMLEDDHEPEDTGQESDEDIEMEDVGESDEDIEMEDVGEDVQEDMQEDLQEDMQEDLQEDMQEDLQEDMQGDAQEEVQGDVQNHVQKIVQEKMRRDAQQYLQNKKQKSKGKGKENKKPKGKGKQKEREAPKKPEKKHPNGWTEEKSAIIPALITDPQELAEFRARMRTDDRPVPVINGVAQYRPPILMFPPEEEQFRAGTCAGGASVSYLADLPPFTAAEAGPSTFNQAEPSTVNHPGLPNIRKIILSLNKAGASDRKGTSAAKKVAANKGGPSTAKETGLSNSGTGTRQSSRISTRNSNRVRKPSPKPLPRPSPEPEPVDNERGSAFRRPSKTPPSACLVSPEARQLAGEQQRKNEKTKDRVLKMWFNEYERGIIESTTREKLIQELLNILDDNDEALTFLRTSPDALQTRARNVKVRLDILERYFADQISGQPPRLTRAEIIKVIADILRCNSQFYEMLVFLVEDY